MTTLLALIFDNSLENGIVAFSQILDHPLPSPAILKLYNFQSILDHGRDENKNYDSNRCPLLTTDYMTVPCWALVIYYRRICLSVFTLSGTCCMPILESDWIQISAKLPANGETMRNYLSSLCLQSLINEMGIMTRLGG